MVVGEFKRIQSSVLSAQFAAAAVLLGFAVIVLLNAGCRQSAPTGRAGSAVATPVAAVSTEPFINSIGMELMPIHAGEFVMGSPAGEAGRDADEIQHKVRITKPFLLGVYPVTQQQYTAVMGTNPNYFHGEDFPVEERGNLPADSVSWDEAVAFCKKLSAKEGRTYRLPTEAEREYACRAGSTGAYAGGSLNEIGWYLGNSGGTTHPVGTLAPNDWGLYDMQGNVWEWCSDWYAKYPPGDATDPIGPAKGTTRILRGGCMDYDQEFARCAFRNYYVPEAQLYYIGFRVVLEPR